MDHNVGEAGESSVPGVSETEGGDVSTEVVDAPTMVCI